MYSRHSDWSNDGTGFFGLAGNPERKHPGQSHLFRIPRTQTTDLAWYCARTKPKHEHIAAANVSRNLGLEVFQPRLRVERLTQRGIVHVVEPLFPCYIFVRCVLDERLNEIRYTTGVSSLVHFGDGIPPVPDSVVKELRESFEAEDPVTMGNDCLSRGARVVLADGAFAGMNAFVLRALPARHRVQVLLDILGRATPVEVDRSSIVVEKGRVADRIPLLALVHQEMLRV